MAGLARSLERDTQIESFLHPRARELGLFLPFEANCPVSYHTGSGSAGGESSGDSFTDKPDSTVVLRR